MVLQSDACGLEPTKVAMQLITLQNGLPRTQSGVQNTIIAYL